MNFALRVFLAGLAGLAAHVALLVVLSGGQFGLSMEFLRELWIRYTVAGVFTLSIAWPFHRFVTGAIVAFLMAIHIAFIIWTFQGEFSFFVRALWTNTVGGLGMAAGAALAAMFIKSSD